MRLLFICNQNLNRSKTAEDLFKEIYGTRSAGLYNDKPVSESELEWADIIIVMEEIQRKELSIRFPKTYMKKRIISLDIPDVYAYGDESLKQKLFEKINELVEPLIE